MRRTDPEAIRISGPPDLPASPQIVVAALSGMITPRRLERIEKVAAQRTYEIVPVLEDITDPHNTSAILRTCDAFGLQQIHAIQGSWGFQVTHKISRGTHRWLDLTPHENAEACARALKGEGRTIVVASMDGELTPADLAKIERPAIVFGNEHRGPSKTLRDFADHVFAVPMVGFVESLNVSVAAAVTLYAATRGRHGTLTKEEREVLVARYLMATVRDAERVVRSHIDAP